MNHISQYLPKTHHCIAATAIGLVSFATGSSPVTAIAIAALSQLPNVINIEEQVFTLIEPSIKKLVEKSPYQYQDTVGITLSSATLLGLSTCSIYGGGLLSSTLFGTHSISLIQAGMGGACAVALRLDNMLGFQMIFKASTQINSFVKGLIG